MRRQDHVKGQIEFDFGVDSTPPPKNSCERTWLASAAAVWAEVHQRKMTIRWARDVSIMRPLLRQHGADELKDRWWAYVRTMNTYFAKRGWDIPTFAANVDRYWGKDDRVALVLRAGERNRCNRFL